MDAKHVCKEINFAETGAEPFGLPCESGQGMKSLRWGGKIDQREVCAAREQAIDAVGHAFSFRFSGWAPNDSAIELDWSMRNKKQVGCARLNSAL